MSRQTIVDLFFERARASQDRTALLEKHHGRFLETSWDKLAEDVRRIAAGLVNLEVQPGDRVVQLSENRYEWIVCDLAIQTARAIHVPVHATLTAAQVAYQLADSGARVAFASTPEQTQKLEAASAAAGVELQIYCFEPAESQRGGPPVRSWQALAASAGSREMEDVEQEAHRCLTGDNLATILYTSGTTGQPKGVMLTQRNLVSNTRGILEVLGHVDDDLRLNFLPLSHIFARTCDMYTWIAAGIRLALAESRETVLADCAAVGPTTLNAVPYFYDKVRRGLIEHGRADDKGGLQAMLGGRVRLCCSGGAALPDHVYDFFEKRGLPILQGYGLTETSPVIAASTPSHVKRGAVGKAVPGVEIKVAASGEILTRGPHVMAGYYNNPQATSEMIRNGWLHTGDLGRMDDEGFLFITGRKKEILVTSGGKNVAPVGLEIRLTADPLILQAMVVGDGRDYLAALIVPDPDELRKRIADRQIRVTSPQEALEHPEVLALYEERIGQRLREVSRYEQVQKFALLDRGFTIESGELTPKLSLRREAIAHNFRDKIEAMYQAAGCLDASANGRV